jgi:hypothetical protein
MLKVRSKKNSFQKKFVPISPFESSTHKKFHAKMSQPRRASTSPSTTLVDLDTPITENRGIWQSPIVKPKPKKLLRPFQNAKQKQESDKGRFFSSEGEGTDDEEEAKFAAFAGDWAVEDKKRNLQLDTLESLEDLMETTMSLADMIVRMINKMKKELRTY